MKALTQCAGRSHARQYSTTTVNLARAFLTSWRWTLQQLKVDNQRGNNVREHTHRSSVPAGCGSVHQQRGYRTVHTSLPHRPTHLCNTSIVDENIAGHTAMSANRQVEQCRQREQHRGKWPPATGNSRVGGATDDSTENGDRLTFCTQRPTLCNQGPLPRARDRAASTRPHTRPGSAVVHPAVPTIPCECNALEARSQHR